MPSIDACFGDRVQMQQTLNDAVPIVVHAVKSTVERPPGTVPVHEIQSALKCFQAWMNLLPTRFAHLAYIIVFTKNSTATSFP
jgi:hypothetical protein